MAAPPTVERVVRLLTVSPVCAVADVVDAAAARGAAWPSLGGFPLLRPACQALRRPSFGRGYSSYAPSLYAWCGAHGPALVLQTLLFACLLIPAARALVDRASDTLGRVALSTPAVKAGKRPLNQAKLRKWREASWKLVSYGALTAFGLHVTLRQPWAADTTLLWKGWPAHDHSSQLRLFYAWQMGHYVNGLVYQLVWESRRKDHAAMVVHHGATLALLGVSFAFNFLRVGALIEVLHDACDVWMEAAKLNVYLQWSNGATVLFVVFMASWVLLRMAYFPLVIIRSTCLEAAAAIMPAFGPTPLTLAVWASINALLLVLLALHCYWFYFIVLIAVRTAKGDPADVRSDDEGEDSPAASPQKKKAA